ncbi:hypothetical protein FOTG_16748 [Fusarium oxysporum f. sp. vasinfectum 25433]|uniref:Uncharacterized protein n=1 Tax=Fusarium oxysporum f. sp. vasinfectum 25433 TaxID=1089449 RepID=X0M2I5_FUSOX|nr:hypothetical protein FOTG_16748 [Fusarium oxysporum f. sp. vasinfectum 25433]
MRKGHMTLALNGIAAPQEMHRLKKKALRRAKLEEGTSVLYEVVYIRRWFEEVRARVRRNVRDVKIKEIFSHKKKHWQFLLQFKNQADWWCKADHCVYLDSAVSLSQRYALHRELQEQNKLIPEWQLAVKMPSFYDTTVIAEALRFIVLDEQERRANKALMLGYEADGLEIIEEIEGENGVEEFIIVKGEDSERDLKLSSISIYQLKSYVIP